jgi:hypothetical protein
MVLIPREGCLILKNLLQIIIELQTIYSVNVNVSGMNKLVQDDLQLVAACV